MTARKQVRRRRQRHVKFVQIVSGVVFCIPSTGRSVDTMAALDADGDVWFLDETMDKKVVESNGVATTSFENRRHAWTRLTRERI